jgi:hypothetical protein
VVPGAREDAGEELSCHSTSGRRRSHRTQTKPFDVLVLLLLLFVFPLARFTYHAFVVLLEFVDADHRLTDASILTQFSQKPIPANRVRQDRDAIHQPCDWRGGYAVKNSAPGYSVK